MKPMKPEIETLMDELELCIDVDLAPTMFNRAKAKKLLEPYIQAKNLANYTAPLVPVLEASEERLGQQLHHVINSRRDMQIKLDEADSIFSVLKSVWDQGLPVHPETAIAQRVRRVAI